MIPTYMSMPMVFVLFFSLWVTIANAQGDGPLSNISIYYGPREIRQGPPFAEPSDFWFGDCIPAMQSGQLAKEAVTGMYAICVQYELADCKGKVLDQKFELKPGENPISINYTTAKSLVCIPKQQK
ncbi:hypothetical protein BCR42DRAFT_426101 [Absidia repens]|uniref:Uncharacterized protein n=1 Tax=Absidia repens TaxID=90262 RepID=A0A1X2I1D9_9FUNG|nr:hypothetical protein BCR42DRAFT_426101 [Absidia repens]